MCVLQILFIYILYDDDDDVGRPAGERKLPDMAACERRT